MGQLLRLILRNGGFLTLLLVEAFAFYIIVQWNTKQNAIFTHSMGLFTGRVLDKRQQMSDYTSLKEQNRKLHDENTKLHEQLSLINSIEMPKKDTSFITIRIDTIRLGDSVAVSKIVRPQYRYIAARVIGNSIDGANNWIYLNRGSDDGLRPNMGVVTGEGIVGIVRHVDRHFSAAMSVLHREAKISVSLKKQKALGSLIWDGGDPTIAFLKFVPKHFDVKEDDEIVTSGFSDVFPKGIPVGKVLGDPRPDKENQYFWDIKVRLSQDMSSVNDVYVVANIFSVELDSLKQKVQR